MSDWPAVALDFLTFAAICVAIWQGILAQRIAKRGFLFEAVRQVPTIAPLIAADFRRPTDDDVRTRQLFSDRYLVFINRGVGVATGVRAAFYLDGQVRSAADNTLSPMRPGDVEYIAPITKEIDAANIAKLRIWYDDVLGNRYITEYKRLGATGRYYVWRRPWVGREFNLPKPDACSDELSWEILGHEQTFIDQSLTRYDSPLGKGVATHSTGGVGDVSRPDFM